MAKSSSRKFEQKHPQSNLLWVVGALIAVIAIGVAVILALSAGGAGEITPAEALARRDQGAFILDVRTEAEWAEYHIPGSVLIPLDELAGRIDEVPRNREVVVICKSGSRSQKGRDILKNAGFTNVVSMKGGLLEWQKQGYPALTGS